MLSPVSKMEGVLVRILRAAFSGSHLTASNKMGTSVFIRFFQQPECTWRQILPASLNPSLLMSDKSKA